MNAYPVTFKLKNGTTITGELVTTVTLPTDFWTLSPAGNGIEYSAYPAGNPPAPSWTAIPNFLTQNTSLSVNIQTTYLTPTSGAVVTLNGSLPAGWAFNGTLLTYNGSSVSGPNTVSFTALYNTFSVVSNTFSVSGVGSTPADILAPTVPLALSPSALGSTTVTLGGPTPSDPSPLGTTWSGMKQINLTRTPPGIVLYRPALAAGNQPTLSLLTIGPQTTIFTQSGADLSVTTNATDAPYPTVDGLAFPSQAVTGTFWWASCKVSSFVTSNAFSNVGIQARASALPNSAYVAVGLHPFLQGQGFFSEYRAVQGGNTTTLQTSANSASPGWVLCNRNGDTYSFYFTLDGIRLTSLGTQTQAMGNTVFVGFPVNSSDGSTVGPVVIQQTSIQTLANWSQVDNTLVAGTTYNYAVTSQDVAGNISASSPPIVVTAGSGGGTPPANDLFPRSFALVQGGQSHYNDAAFKTLMGKFNIVEMDPYLGIEGDIGATLASICATIVANGTANSITSRPSFYVNNQAQSEVGQGGDAHTFVNWSAQIDAANWWLRSSYPGGAIVGDTGGFVGGSCNNSSYNTVVASGRTYFQAFARYFWNVMTQGNAVSLFGESSNFATNASLACFFNDNRFWVPRVTGAWANDGTSYNPGSQQSTLYPRQQQGHAAQLAAFRALDATRLLIGNVDFFNNYPGSGASAPQIDPSSVGLYDGVFCEEAIGQVYSKETFGGSIGLMNALIASEPMIRSGGTLILHQDGRPGGGQWSSTSQASWGVLDWRGARFGGAMAYMRNYHWAPSCSNYSAANPLFFDELQQGGTLGWLGTASDAQQSGSWLQGVWRRRFSGGWVLWNPRGNGTQTVALGGTMHKLTTAGLGDPTVNNGAAVSSVTLQDADGLFLLP